MKKRMKLAFVFSLIFASLIISSLVVSAAACPNGAAGTCFYIRGGATGTTCSDWSSANACDSLPANLVRGATYYIADVNLQNKFISAIEASAYINAYFAGGNSLIESLYALTLAQSGGSYMNLSGS